MATGAVDTNVFVALADTEDRHHDDASAIVRGIDSGELPSCSVTNYVVLETLNWTHNRLRRDKGIEIYRRLHESAGFDVRQTVQKDFHRSLDVFERHDRLSFGDATIVAYMRREGIEYLYTFDDDFDGIDGITRLSTAENPFE